MDFLDKNIKISEVISLISKSTGMPINHLTAEIVECIQNGQSLEDALIYILDHNFQMKGELAND